MFIDSKSPKRAVTRLLISALCHSPFSISIKSPIFSVKYRLAVAMHLSKSAADGNVNFSVSSPLISSVAVFLPSIAMSVGVISPTICEASNDVANALGLPLALRVSSKSFASNTRHSPASS